MNTRIKNIFLKSEFLSFILIVFVSLAFGIANPVFLSINNIFDLLKMCVMPGIFACGVMIVLINGGVDFSFLWVGMFSAYSTSKMLSILQISYGIEMPLGVVFLISMCIGGILGLLNALLVSKLEIPVFIATLCSANIIMGVLLRFVGNVYIFPTDMPRAMIRFSDMLIFTKSVGANDIIGLHVSVICMVVVMIITHLILRYTMVGRSVFALGGDISSAERVGLNLTSVRLFVYVFSGIIYGLAGAIAVSNIQVANPYDFQGRELTVISAIIIGGVRITGGGGSVIGVALGVLLTNIISQNLVLIGVKPEYNKLIFGILIVVAVIIQAIQEKAKKRI